MPDPFRPVEDAPWMVWLRLRSDPNQAGRGRLCRRLDRDGGVTVPRWANLHFPPLNCSPNPHQGDSSGFLPKVQTHRGGRRGAVRAVTPSPEPGGDGCLGLSARFGKAAAPAVVGALRVNDVTGQNCPGTSESCESRGLKKAGWLNVSCRSGQSGEDQILWASKAGSLSLVTRDEPCLSQGTRQTFAPSGPSHPGSRNASSQADRRSRQEVEPPDWAMKKDPKIQVVTFPNLKA